MRSSFTYLDPGPCASMMKDDMPQLNAMLDVIIKSDIEKGIRTTLIGKKIHLLSEVISTNTLAMDMASKGATEGTVVIAETQTGGKGRLGRKWISPEGNLYLSVILRPNIPTRKAPLITLMGAVAVASAIRKHLGVKAAIKWPNDVMISDKKCCGLLSEMSAEHDTIKYIVLGIGVNVNMELYELPSDIRNISTTLSAEADAKIDRTPLLRRLLMELDRWYQVFLKNEAIALKEWENLNITTGKRVAVSGAGETIEGTAQGIDNEGRLIIRPDDGALRQIASGDVTILKRQ